MKDFLKKLTAPCGINCRICRAYLRDKNKCPGCREPDKNKPITRVVCKIKICDELKRNNLNYCIECKKFPCENVKHLDKRYNTKYNMSVIENLTSIKENGINIFLQKQEKKYKCPQCEGIICVHNRKCYNCGAIIDD
jgi:hypothetical protein